MSVRRWVTLFALVVMTLTTGRPGLAAPICPGDEKILCGGRTVPEPLLSVSFLTPAEFVAVVDSLAAEFPGWITRTSMGVSFDSHDLLQVEVSDPASPVPRDQRPVLYIAQSIHGNEMGGREGMARVIEDLVRTEDPAVAELLGRLRVVQFIPNPDGWVAGDVLGGGLSFTRENANGTDLNRQFPWRGWIPHDRQPVSEPEAQAVVADVIARRMAREEVVGSVDIHGFNNQYGAWIMLSSGEFDWGATARQIQIGEAVGARLDAVLGENAVFAIGEALGGIVQPHVLTSSSEWLGGLSGSGFLGDWLAHEDGLGTSSISTVELFLLNGQNTLMYERELAQIHVDSVRAIVRAMMDVAFVPPATEIDLAGSIGYVHGDQEVTHATQPDPVSPMRFFEDLDPYVDQEVRRLDPHELTEQLADLTAVVATTDQVLAAAGALEVMRAWTEAGGSLVLTDRGLRLLPHLFKGIHSDDVVQRATDFGNADFVDRDHPLAAGVRNNALHTYEPATLGYDTEFDIPQAPVWTVDRTVWEGLSGATVATTAGETSIGELALGQGVVRIIGGLLPPATTENKVLYGLANYAPADSGYHVFFNALRGEPLEGGDGGQSPSDTDTPATGGGLVTLSWGALALLALLRDRGLRASSRIAATASR